MSTIVRNRLRFERNFTQIPNAWMRDDRISFGARGLLAHLMTHDESWETSIAALVRNGPQGKSAVNGLIKELEAAGYLIRQQSRAAGKFESSKYLIVDPFDEIIGEIPGESPLTDFRATGKRSPGNPPAGNRPPKKTKFKNTNLEEDQSKEEGGETRVVSSPERDESDERITPYADLGGGLGGLKPLATPRRDRCDFHQGVDYPPPCRGCKEAREKMISEDRHKMHADFIEHRALEAAAIAERYKHVEECGLCDDDGYRNGWLCDHDPERRERVAQGAALLRQALRGDLDG